MGNYLQIRNERWNYIEAVVTSVALFALYKFVLVSLGIAVIGIWSIVVATTSLGRMADVGTAGGLGRYIAILQVDGTKDAESRADATLIYVETGLLFSAFIFALIGAALYLPALYAIRLAVPESAMKVVVLLLPFSLLSFVTTNVASVSSAALIGMHRSDQKSKISILASLLQVFIAIMLKDKLGLVGLALAQVVQALFVLVGSWLTILYLVKRKLTLALPRRLWLAPLKDIAGFGLKLQLTSILGLLSEPAMKYVLSIVGGLATVGIYELVSKGILLSRQFIIAPTPNLVPAFSASLAGDRTLLAHTYSEATAKLVVLGVGGMALIAITAPLISVIWLGSIQTDFVLYSVIMAAGWAVNIVGVPGFSLAIATGRLGGNILGNTITLVIGPVVGFVLATTFSEPAYAVGANAFAIAIGATFSAVYMCRSLNIEFLPNLSDYHFTGHISSLFRRN